MAPRIDGDVALFSEHGLYDGLFLMRDETTGTFWDHMTGEAVYGPKVGTTLEVETLRQLTPELLLNEDRDALIALSDQRLSEDDELKTEGLLAGIRGRLGEFFSATVDEEDDRRPTMDLGLGLWGGETEIYYPYDTVNELGRALLHRYEGRGILVYLDPTSYSLAAVFTEADEFRWDDDVLRLSDGSYIEGSVYYGANGERLQDSRPLQVFTRWYGFSLTFPDVPIYQPPAS